MQRWRPRHDYGHPLPSDYWDDRENRIAFMRWLDDLRPGKRVEKWRSLTLAEFIDHHAGGLIDYFRGSVERAVSEYLDDTGGGLRDEDRLRRLEFYAQFEYRSDCEKTRAALEHDFLADTDPAGRVIH
jgi:hypothetical protein